MARREYDWGTAVSPGDTSRAEAAARAARVEGSTARKSMTSGIEAYMTKQQARNQATAEMELDQLPNAAARDAFLGEMKIAQKDPAIGDAMFGADLPSLQKKLPAMATQDLQDINYQEKQRAEEDRVTAIKDMQMLQQDYGHDATAFRDNLNRVVTDRVQSGQKDAQGIFSLSANRLLRESNIKIQPMTLSNLGINLDDVNTHTTSNYNQLHQKITNRLMNENVGADLATAQAMATASINKSPHGEIFRQQMKFEKGQTKHDVALTKHAGALTVQMNLRDTVGVDRELNKLLDFMHSNRIKPEDAAFFNKDIERALQRTHLFTEAEIAVVKSKDPTLDFTKIGLGQQAEFLFSTLNPEMDISGEDPIGLKEQLLFKNHLRERYRGKYTHLTDAMLDAQIDKVINQSNRLGSGFVKGVEIAKADSENRAAYVKSEHEYRADQRKKVQGIGKKGGLRYLADNVRSLIEKATADMDSKAKNNTMNKAMKETDQIVKRFKGIFTDPNSGKFAFDKGSDAYLAFWLTVNNSVMGSLGVDVDMLSANDIVLGLIDNTDEMHDAPLEKLLDLFIESQPRADSSIIKTFANDPKNVRNIQQGAYELETAIESAKKRVADPANKSYFEKFWIDLFIYGGIKKKK